MKRSFFFFIFTCTIFFRWWSHRRVFATLDDTWHIDQLQTSLWLWTTLQSKGVSCKSDCFGFFKCSLQCCLCCIWVSSGGCGVSRLTVRSGNKGGGKEFSLNSLGSRIFYFTTQCKHHLSYEPLSMAESFYTVRWLQCKPILMFIPNGWGISEWWYKISLFTLIYKHVFSLLISFNICTLACFKIILPMRKRE